jgi:excisionase family DNA binding protein
MADPSELELLGVRNAAKQLGVHENTLRRWEEQGVLQACRLPSGVRRFRTDEIARLRAEIYDSQAPANNRAAAVAASRLPVAQT